MPRAVPEWIGKTPDAKIPDRVKDRVFERYHRRCHRSGREIRAGDAWQCDHVIALINGGEHREKNLAPILLDKHKEKTAEDLKIKSKNYRVRKRHYGFGESKRLIPGSKGSGIRKPLSRNGGRAYRVEE